ncbi:helix-turn-helix domain-containing protein [Thermobifida cellulosilytica]|uniref:DNA-binding protein n=1 Tax=Thermobifida cellulosilytica TB100 TaxID=665004 RepID=A0A147KJW8_THECS|nr:helix-turn-helix transcriptional regulator [Thermobifida cellulosilytica]KUP97587.1 DNA-binding protein [Thermobifida cellulosilytica TB100]
MAARMPVRRRHLVIQLKRLRREAGLSQDEVWKALGWSRAKLQRLEAGDFQRLRAGDIMALCQIYKADEAVAQELIQIARDSRTEKPWWTQYKDVLPGAFLGLETEATLIQEYNIALVPGLLQTRDYTAALMRTSVDIHGEEEIRRRLEIRAERQRAVLDRDNPPMVMAVIDEAAVRRQIGGGETMKSQVRHLIELSERPRVDIQVLPFAAGAHAAAGIPFTILGFDGTDAAGSVVYLETHKDGYYLDTDEEIARYRLIFGRTQGSAMSVEDSRDFLERLLV